MAVDMNKLMAFVGKAVVDIGGTMHAALVVVGEKRGLYKALAKGPCSSEELAKRTASNERYVREWLSSQAAGGYVEYDPKTQQYSMNEEQIFALTDEKGAIYLPGAFQLALAAVRSEERVSEAFRTGAGIGWHEHDAGLFCGTERFFRPNYAANLLSAWIPALEGVEARLKQGARVADVGCGHGSSTILMAEAFPKSTFVGYDYHEASIATARQRATEAGVADRVKFDTAKAKDYPGRDFDFVTFFDCLHDMGDPAGAAAHVKQSLKADGTWMIVEPYAGDRVEQNLNPVGRLFYSASTLLCTPASKSQEVGLALGAQAGEARMKNVVTSGGFSRFRRAAETPFNLVYEARP
ncbi:MAG: methyltransferase domain-containing protein [Acidipila sp.]|nr:methyltransferase domain-containing protein [Acidipila sp.]